MAQINHFQTMSRGAPGAPDQRGGSDRAGSKCRCWHLCLVLVTVPGAGRALRSSKTRLGPDAGSPSLPSAQAVPAVLTVPVGTLGRPPREALSEKHQFGTDVVLGHKCRRHACETKCGRAEVSGPDGSGRASVCPRPEVSSDAEAVSSGRAPPLSLKARMC